MPGLEPCGYPNCPVCDAMQNARRPVTRRGQHLFVEDEEIRRRERGLRFAALYGRPASGFNLPARDRQSDSYDTILRGIYSTRNIQAPTFSRQYLGVFSVDEPNTIDAVPTLETHGWRWVTEPSISATKAWFSTFSDGWRQVAIAHTAAVYMMEVHVDGNRITNAAAILKYAGLEKEAGDSK